jgi:hypothetical protein
MTVNRLNLLTGAFASTLIDVMREDEYVGQAYGCFGQLFDEYDTQAMYYLLYLFYVTVEIGLPYLFLAVGGCNHYVLVCFP